MEAIRAANFLTNNDEGGGEWIRFNRVAPKAGEEARGRGGRRAGAVAAANFRSLKGITNRPTHRAGRFFFGAFHIASTVSVTQL